MNYLKLIRSPLDNCTPGKVYHDDPINHICYTIERPWLSNKPNISCIPPGEYELHRISTPKHPDAFYLSNPDLGVSWNGDTTRTLIEMHIFNFPGESKGCIGPGMSLHPTHWGVSRSADAMKMLNELIKPGEEWRMIIE